MNQRVSFLSRYRYEIFLFLTALFIRFPFFFRDYIDKDESTFILMGQSIADGHLPYDHLWDLKPPLLFYFFALIEKVFPHSFFAIRFFGMLIVFLSAILLLKIVKQIGLKNGFLIALGFVLLSSEFGSLQGVMSEHFAVFFLMLGLYFFLRKKSYDFLICGVAFGCAVLCKLNYAYAIATLLVYYFISERKNLKAVIQQLIFVTGGVLIPIIVAASPFLLENKTALFFNSVFLAPMKYASALQFNVFEKLKVTWWIIALVMVVSIWALRRTATEGRPKVFAMVSLLAGTVYTFFSSGIVNGHYLVQVYPFLLILLLGIIVQKNFRLNLGVVATAVLLLSFESVMEYYRLIASVKDPAEYRSTFEVIRELKNRKLDKGKIFFADYHIGYWLLHQYPLTKSTTHPSNLARPYLFPYYNNSNETSLQELKYIMEDVKPEVIVSESDNLSFFAGGSPENLYFKESLHEDFEMIYKDTVDRIYIWERKSK